LTIDSDDLTTESSIDSRLLALESGWHKILQKLEQLTAPGTSCPSLGSGSTSIPSFPPNPGLADVSPGPRD